jgi:adenylyltransferase/sulfurtransferase
MNVKIKLLKPFSDIAGKGELKLDFTGGSAIQALERICESYPDLRKELFEEDGKISYSVNIFVNDMPLVGEQEDAPLKEGDEILIFLAVSGG